MKAGNLVKLSTIDYPQYEGKIGMLIDEVDIDQWAVLINGKPHPYRIHTISMQVVEAN